MRTLMLGMLAWCSMSVLAAALWAAVGAGARRGAARGLPASHQPHVAVRTVPAGVLPGPRTAGADAGAVV